MGRSEFYYDENRKQYRKRIKIDGTTRDVWANTKQELRDRVDEIKIANRKGLMLDDNTTLAEYAREWCPVATAKMTHSGAKDYKNAINVHICPFFKNAKLKEIKPLHIDKFLSEKAHLSYSMQAKILRTMRKLFDSAAENGLINKNPTDKKKAGGLTKKKTALTREQQDTLLEAVKNTRAYLFVALGLFAGLRREEILGLAWSDVYLNDPAYIEVTHIVRYNGMKPIRSRQLKSEAAHRKIPLPPVLSEALQAEKVKSKSKYVIPDTHGNLCSMTAYKNIWNLVKRRMTKQTNKKYSLVNTVIDFHVTPHILRHTYITELCASGLDIKKIQYLAGHSKVSTTLDVYTTVTNNKPEQLLPAISAVFSNR